MTNSEVQEQQQRRQLTRERAVDADLEAINRTRRLIKARNITLPAEVDDYLTIVEEAIKDDRL